MTSSNSPSLTGKIEPANSDAQVEPVIPIDGTKLQLQKEFTASSRALLFNLRATQTFLPDFDPLVQYAQEIADTLRGVKPDCPSLKVHIYADLSVLDGFCLSDGTLVMSLGLLEACRDSKDVLAFFVVHEATHVLLNHSVNSAVEIQKRFERNFSVSLPSLSRNAIEDIGEAVVRKWRQI